MKKKILIPVLVVVAALVAAIVWLVWDNYQQRQDYQAMQELAELDKQEMENEYESFALQYSEMMTKINNDSIIAQLTQEQLRTQQLLAELKQVRAERAEDVREIARLKKELTRHGARLRD